MGKIYCYANFFHYANFSIVFGPNFGGGQTALGGRGGGLSGTKPANSVTAFMWVILQTYLSTILHIQCPGFNVHSSLFSNHSAFYVSFPKTEPSNVLIFSIKDLCAGPKVETAQNWKRVRSCHFWVSPKLETCPQLPLLGNPKTGNGRSFHSGLDPKLETQLPDSKVETRL